jgi:hypothetical protein
MWIEINNKEIVGVHDEESSVKNNTWVFLEEADFTSIGKWYTKAKGVHDPVLTKTQQADEDLRVKSEEAKLYLKSTDYVVTKLSEAIALDDLELKAQIIDENKEIFSKRSAYRLFLNPIKGN